MGILPIVIITNVKGASVKRQYQEEYVMHVFSFIIKDGIQCPHSQSDF